MARRKGLGEQAKRKSQAKKAKSPVKKPGEKTGEVAKRNQGSLRVGDCKTVAAIHT
jgi:hypothetical protein